MGGGGSRWRWSLVLVASLHLLTTAGVWTNTDKAEDLLTARRLLDRGTFTLAEPGVTRVPEALWLWAPPGETLKPRLFPLSALTLVPLLFLDRVLGLETPRQYGRLVHLQGHIFVLGALALLGMAVRRWGGSPRAAAATVVLVGTLWPVWAISRRGCAEPIMAFLIALYLLGTAAYPGPSSRRADLARALACFLLAWTNPTGPFLAGALIGADVLVRFLQASERAKHLLPPVLATIAGNLSVLVLWNLLFHGSLWGGYARYDMVRFGVRSPLEGIVIYVGQSLPQVFVLIGVVAAGLVACRGRWASLLAHPVALLGVVLAVFSTHYVPEPVRRLSVVWPAWGLAAGRTWDPLSWRRPWPQTLLAVGALVGFYWFMVHDGRHYQGPGGLFYPGVLWVELAVAGRPLWVWALPVAVLLGVLVVSASKVWRLLDEPV
jgi:hypothetical protein